MMLLDEETAQQIQESLAHLHFVRELLRRTGHIDEFERAGWAYGMDWNGGFDVQESQLDSLIEILGLDVKGNVVTFEPNDADVMCDLIGFYGDEYATQQLQGMEYVFCLRFDGDESIITELACFIKWLNPNGVILKDVTVETPHLIWVLGETFEDPSDLSLCAFEQILFIWEVMEYYGNVTNTPAWRKSRGTDTVDTRARDAA